MKLLLPITLMALVCMLPSACRSGGGHGDEQLVNVDRSGLALQGYDPVAYFPEGSNVPQRGRVELAIKHEGATYRFANPENLARFAADPERYVPAYGGWCAWAMVNGERVSINPRSFLIEDGRLLLFYDSLFADTRARWREANSPALGAEADSHWTVIVREAASRP